MAAAKGHDPIHLDPKNKGLLHKTLGVPEGETIPVELLEKAAKSEDETVRKRAQFALNARKFKHLGAKHATPANKDDFREKFMRGELDTEDTNDG